jgi:signal transduction histidine kinase
MLKAYVIANIITAFCNLSLAVFVYLKDRKNIVNINYFLSNFSIALWAFGFAMAITAPDKTMGLFWIRFLNVGAILVPLFFLHFVFSLLKIYRQKKALVISTYIISFLFLILNYTPLYTQDVAPIMIFKSWAVPGPLYPLFIIMFFSYIVYASYTLFKGLQLASPAEKNQLRYVAAASIIGFVGGSTTFFPAFNINLYPFGTLFVSLNALIISYAIIKHRLMDIEFVIRKGVIYAYTSFLLLIPTFLFTLGAQQYTFQKINIAFSCFVLVCMILAAYLFPKVRLQAESTVEQYLFKEKYDYKKTISDLNQAMVSILDINELCKKIISTTTEAMNVHKASIFIFNEEKESFLLSYARGLDDKDITKSFRRDDQFVKLLERRREIMIREELERFQHNPDMQIIYQTMTSMVAETCIPLIAKQKLIGFINLGIKGNKKMYTHEDLELLTTLANSATIAIENAQLYENLKNTKKVMLRADRLASLGTLAAGLAHEIRNPLVAIKTFTQLLPERFDDEEFRNYFTSVAAGEIDRISTLITELLEFSRPSGPFFQQENLNGILDKMITLIKTEAKQKELEIETTLADDLPTVTVDKEQIKQVFINILLNAIQATPEKGTISIVTRKIAKTNGTPGFVQVEISDTGVGIPEEELDKIFTPFFTTRAKGSGLGLAITHQIIQEHEGTIDVRSAVHKGTTFSINLPINPLVLKQHKNNDQLAN